MLNPLRVITLFEQIPDQVRVSRKVHIKSYWPPVRTTLEECCSKVFRLCITEIEFWFSSSEIQSFVLQYLYVYAAVKIYFNLLTKVLNSVWLLLFSVLLAKGDIGACRPEKLKKNLMPTQNYFPCMPLQLCWSLIVKNCLWCWTKCDILELFLFHYR